MIQEGLIGEKKLRVEKSREAAPLNGHMRCWYTNEVNYISFNILAKKYFVTARSGGGQRKQCCHPAKMSAKENKRIE
jgi:hypothetical protein